MKNLSKAKSFLQCFICREWSWEVCTVPGWGGAELCLPCYVDVLEVRQARGVMGPSGATGRTLAGDSPGNSPSPFLPGQLMLFEGAHHQLADLMPGTNQAQVVCLRCGKVEPTRGIFEEAWGACC